MKSAVLRLTRGSVIRVAIFLTSNATGHAEAEMRGESLRADLQETGGTSRIVFLPVRARQTLHARTISRDDEDRPDGLWQIASASMGRLRTGAGGVFPHCNA